MKDKYECLKVAENMIPAIQEQMGGAGEMEGMMDNEAYALMDENMSGLGAINIR